MNPTMSFTAFVPRSIDARHGRRGDVRDGCGARHTRGGGDPPAAASGSGVVATEDVNVRCQRDGDVAEGRRR